MVGGGAVGSAVAYFLALEGARVLLLDQDAIGAGASAHATGSINMLGSEFSPGATFQMGLESYLVIKDLAPQLEEETGMDLLFQVRPSLRLALEEGEERLIRDMMAWQKELIPLSWIDGDEVRRIEPRLSASIRGAVHQDESIQLDAHRLTLAMARAAELNGAQVGMDRVTGLMAERGHVKGVHCSEGDYPCDTVVLAMGAWSEESSTWLDFPVPVGSLKGERLLMTYDGPPLPVLITSPKRGHMISRMDGFLSVGSTGGRDYDRTEAFLGIESDQQPTEKARLELQQNAVDVFPDLQHAGIVQQLAGSRPMTPDRMPLIGPVPGWDGVFLAAGHGPKGVHLAPITGKIIASWALRGTPNVTFTLDHCLPGRFAGHGLHDLRAVGESAEQ